MKNIVIILFIIGLFCSFMYVGSKGNPATPTKKVIGLWTGKYYMTGGADTNYCSYAIQPNGRVIHETWADFGSSQNFGTGTWKIVDDTLVCIIKNVYGKYKGARGEHRAYFDKRTGKMSVGRWWSIVPGVEGGGYFTIKKVQ